MQPQDDPRENSPGAGQVVVDHIARRRSCVEFATSQDGALRVDQLHLAGLERSGLRTLVRQGVFVPWHRGVFTLAGQTGPRTLEMAAVLAGGERSAIAGMSSAYLREYLPYPEPYDAVEIVKADGRLARTERLIPTRVSGLLHREIDRINGIPVISRARALLAVSQKRPELLDRAFDQAVFKRRAVVTEVGELLARTAGRAGVPALRQLHDAEAAGERSRLEGERRLKALFRSARLPEFRVNHEVGRYRADFLWEKQRVVVEMDGFATHGTRRSFEEDRARDAWLAANGYRVIRVTWRQLTNEPNVVLARVAATLALAA